MRNLQDTFETRKQSFISAYSICVSVTLIHTEILHDKFFPFIYCIYSLEGILSLALWHILHDVTGKMRYVF